MEGTGYKCLCIDGRMGDKCQNWTSKWKTKYLSKLTYIAFQLAEIGRVMF